MNIYMTCIYMKLHIYNIIYESYICILANCVHDIHVCVHTTNERNIQLISDLIYCLKFKLYFSSYKQLLIYSKIFKY